MYYRVAIQVKQTDEAWSALQQCFSETIRIWIRSHPSSDLALLHDSEENYLAQTFSRFWFAVHDQHVEFTTLSAALSYLRAILNGLISQGSPTNLQPKTLWIARVSGRAYNPCS